MSANESSKHFKVLGNFALELETLNLMKIIVNWEKKNYLNVGMKVPSSNTWILRNVLCTQTQSRM